MCVYYSQRTGVLDIEAEVSKIISPVYLIGGSVRDGILGGTPKDYDFATPLLPDEVEERVKRSGKRANLKGKRFGTIGFSVAGQFVEITTFRSETYTPGSRKPKVMYVSNIAQDLGRRDFTFNAIASQKGRAIDPFGGKADIEARLIKAVGNPADRFREDPLRMLRAARFASQLEFDVDPATEKAATKKAYHILDVSRER